MPLRVTARSKAVPVHAWTTLLLLLFSIDYKAIGKIGEGTFSEVMKMQSLRDGNFYACKQMKQRFER